MPTPLEGINVLDLTRFQVRSDKKHLNLCPARSQPATNPHHQNGPHATQMLKDYGASVVKIEQPGLGDSGRGARGRDGFQHYAEGLNRGKMSIELDLRNPKAKTVMERLVMWADVVVENFKPGVSGFRLPVDKSALTRPSADHGQAWLWL